MSKHTPGPWKWDDKYFGLRQASDAGGAYILQPEPWHGLHLASEFNEITDRGQRSANANLMKHAPDLLADLIVAAAQLRTYETLHRAKNTEESTAKADVNSALAARLEATIARARGES